MLARIRKAKKISIQDLAEACDMKRQQVSLILNGKTANPGIRTLRRISAALDLDFALVLTEELTSPE
jgi:transcriptional regulator with XRE-family HTH domain